MTEDTQRQPNVEAGDYIEDDPAAWEAWVALLREYGPRFAALEDHLGSNQGAAEVLGGAMLSRLADEHGLFLRRESDRG